jgi:peptidoglycan/xylan/chitin deacetylase (PgdA/CDA1 family)
MKTAYCVPVLMYHHVSPEVGAITVSPMNFERQMKGLLDAGYTTLTCDEFADFLAGKPTPPKSVLLTFDDGYLDNWVYAHPILKKYGLRAAMFVVTGLIGDGPARPCAEHDGVRLPRLPSHLECRALWAVGSTDSAMLRWSEVQAMREAGTFEFHCHTHTHTRWDQVSTTRQECLAHMREEFESSRTVLRQHFGEVSQHFCWPQGYFANDYVSLAQEFGFRYLYTTQAYGQNLCTSNPAKVYRFAVKNQGSLWFLQRVWTSSHPLVGPLYNKWRLWKRKLRA